MSIRRDDLDAGKVDLADVIDSRRAPMKPVPPGDFLRTEFLKPMGLSAYRLAKDINVPLNRIAGILAGKARYHRRHGPAVSALFSDGCAVLDQSSGAVRSGGDAPSLGSAN